MSYYNDPSWPSPAPGRQSSWEQPQPPSRSGTGQSVYNGGGAPPIHMDIGASSTVSRDEGNAFISQFDEVERATENLAKSGKSFGPGFPPTPVSASRRESMPMMGGGGGGGGGPPRPYPEYEQRMGGPGSQRHHSVSEYDGSRSQSASNAQGFYQNQRYAPRPNDADQMAQAKRRMAAQRERELRNYHQEQQYHRNVSGSKSDRSMSPNAMNEDERRELIARQHRALYGETSTLYNNNPTSSQDVRVQTSAAGRGPSPLAFDPFGMQAQNVGGDAAVQMPPRGDKDVAGASQEARANSNSSPSSNHNPAFSLFDAQQAGRTSNSSPGASPPISGPKSNGSGVAPIGTRPQTQTQNQSLQQPGGAPLSKRATSPLPSPLGYKSYNASEQQNNVATTSASLNPSSTATDKGVGIWNNGPWGNTPTQGVQASVWG
ncbi:uncharacterized protein K460DRAFT_278050 [Cucurbitaria berberidis CBS 394.84]|uniref:Uncharacterized protein n=1 Tax=Cucurbitaria berberidis CBS 394.84 TaxID=1168544 RepID=A0A9P4GLR6_9PLEO|nr:uncharacterized protein K460DRAFT_278050 [Cucurbitaria berberidis CBS 394.84]KAF1847557.1 hypothetical protein K460DRAFT_278050 [Cucurbitaria berberidis CBS 394.84]